MQKLLLHPAYFGSILQFSYMAKNPNWLFENEDNYQKQTYRNRQYIYGANGKLLLNIPVKHSGNKSGHQKYKEVKIENSFHWQSNHWKSLQTAYRTSPFFEFYEDEFAAFYEQKQKHLIDFNYRCMETVCDCLQLDFNQQKTDEYKLKIEDSEIDDKRLLIEAKKKFNIELETYTQVFDEKFGFLPNLSILDLLFNEGPNTLNYLESQQLPTSLKK